MFTKAQGTIEYLVIIAIVVVIGLVVVGLLASFLGSSENVFDSSSDIKNKVGIGGISIIDAVAGADSNGLVVLKNIGSEVLTIDRINIDGVDHNYDKQIVFGETKSFKLDGIDVCDGTKKSYTVIIYYTRASSSLDKSADFQEITLDCTEKVIAPENVVEEETSIIHLSTPYIWVANFNDNNVSKLSSSGASLGTFVVGNLPYGVAVDGSGNVWVTNANDNNVSKLSSSGDPLGTFAVGTSPRGIAIDGSGNVWVANYTSNNVSELSSSGILLNTYNSGVTNPSAIAVDSDGDVWVVGTSFGVVSKLNGSTGESLGTYQGSGSAHGIAVDEENNIWIAFSQDIDGNVSKLNGDTLELMGSLSILSIPYGVAVDGSGNVWVANFNDGYVSKVSSSFVLLQTYSVGTQPSGVAVDADGNVWVANSGGTTVSKLNTSTGDVINYTVGTSPYSLGDFTGFAYQYFILGRR